MQKILFFILVHILYITLLAYFYTIQLFCSVIIRIWGFFFWEAWTYFFDLWSIVWMIWLIEIKRTLYFFWNYSSVLYKLRMEMQDWLFLVYFTKSELDFSWCKRSMQRTGWCSGLCDKFEGIRISKKRFSWLSVSLSSFKLHWYINNYLIYYLLL